MLFKVNRRNAGKRALFCVGAPIGIVLSMIVTGLLTDALGWQSSFYFFGKSEIF